MGETTAAGTRCPRCSAAVRPGAPWCTQCYAPAGVAADPPRPAAEATADTGRVRVVERTAVTGTWPCTACDSRNDLSLDACEGCGAPFLAAARAPRPTVVLPVVGDLLALSPLRRVVVALVVAAAIALTCTAALGLLGLLLG